MTKSSKIKSSGIKPLNAPRVIHVRTDSAGNPVAVQVPPTITSAGGRRGRRNNPRSRAGRAEAALGPARAPRGTPGHPRERGLVPPPLVSDGRWVGVVAVDSLWKVNDEWWRGAEEEIARLYYTLRLDNSQQITVYLDLTANNWYRQAG